MGIPRWYSIKLSIERIKKVCYLANFFTINAWWHTLFFLVLLFFFAHRKLRSNSKFFGLFYFILSFFYCQSNLRLLCFGSKRDYQCFYLFILSIYLFLIIRLFLFILTIVVGIRYYLILQLLHFYCMYQYGKMSS